MRLRLILTALALGLCAVLATADEKAADPMAGMQMGAPAEMKQVEGFVGNWDVAIQYRMDPSASWQESKAGATYEKIVDGSALRLTYVGEFAGMPFKGEGVICYNRGTNKWQNTWIDNMSAQLGVYEGDFKDGKFICAGEDKMPGGIVMQSRMTIFNITDKKFDWTMENSMDGGKSWSTTLKAVYTKK